jgi:uncharacterized membrane protein (UPF0127 family)
MASVARAFASVVLAIVVVACASEGAGEPCGSATVLRFDDASPAAELTVEVADEDAERRQGLMGRRALDADDGMVFLFDGATTGGFWMKDTLIPLSIAFWDEDERIVSILDMQPCREQPCEIHSAGASYVGAVEANLGYFREHGVEVGDRVDLTEADCG